MQSRIGGVLIPRGTRPSNVIGSKTYTPVATYPSKSDPTKDYTVCVVDDGTLSCDCPGWTRRNPPGGRTCRHVEDYDMYLRHDVGEQPAAEPASVSKPKKPVEGGTLSDLFEKLNKEGL